MNKKTNISLRYQNSAGSVKADILMISFIEDGNYIVYTPHLDISGYGANENEAVQAFETSLKMFLDYTINKKTLPKLLLELGWEVKKGSVKRPKKINAPAFSQMITKNPYLEDLLNNHNIRTSTKTVELPV